MITFTNTIRINRSPVDVYAYLSDLENTPEWNWAIVETTKTTPGPVAVGTRYRQTRTVPRPATETMEISDLDANRQIEIQGTLAGMAARLGYDLTDVEGDTEVINTVCLEPHGPLRLAGPVVGHRVKKAVASNLNDLKTRLETLVPDRVMSAPPNPEAAQTVVATDRRQAAEEPLRGRGATMMLTDRTLTDRTQNSVCSDQPDQEQPPSSRQRLARTAGLLYLTVAILGGAAHLVVRGKVYVPGDAATTAANVRAHADLVRIGVVADLAQATIFVFLGMTLYQLLKHTSRDVAGAMMILVAIATTIICLNMVFQFAGLLVATDTSYATALGTAGANTLVLLLFDIQRYGYLIAQIFFGLWLIPLGYLAHRSRLFPKTLAALLVIGGTSYLTGTLIEFLVPNIVEATEPFIYIPPTIAELWMIGYLTTMRLTSLRSTSATAS